MAQEKSVLKDKDYNLVSTLYHALQGAETSELYREDAVSENDQELQDFFRDAHSLYNQLAGRAKGLLARKIG